MSSDTSMVSFAADCCGKLRPVRSAGDTHSSHRERKESNMFTKGLSSSHGFSLAAAALAAVACIGLAGAASASTVTWGSAANIAGATDVSTVGTLVVANEFGGTSPTAQTVNGVTFSPFPLTNSASATQGIVTLSAPVTGDTVNLNSNTNFGPSNFSASYDAMLRGGGAINSSNGLDPMDLTVASLTPGAQYLVEIWVNDSRGYAVSRQETLSGSSSDSAVIDYLTPPGQFITGTFIADNTGSQTISMTPVDQASYGPTQADAQINAFQLRAVPEPATVALLGVGAAGLLLATRKRGTRV